jgi:hypothetical protein
MEKMEDFAGDFTDSRLFLLFTLLLKYDKKDLYMLYKLLNKGRLYYSLRGLNLQ